MGHAPKCMDDVVAVDDMTMLAVVTAATALQRHQQDRTRQQFQPIVIQPHAHAVEGDPVDPSRGRY